MFGGRVGGVGGFVGAMGTCYSAAGGWGHGGIEKLAPFFVKIDEEAKSILNRAGGDIFRILQGGPDVHAASKLESRLRRPDQTNLALAKYLVLMTAVWPDWTRITMIPHR